MAQRTRHLAWSLLATCETCQRVRLCRWRMLTMQAIRRDRMNGIIFCTTSYFNSNSISSGVGPVYWWRVRCVAYFRLKQLCFSIVYITLHKTRLFSFHSAYLYYFLYKNVNKLEYFHLWYCIFFSLLLIIILVKYVERLDSPSVKNT